MAVHSPYLSWSLVVDVLESLGVPVSRSILVSPVPASPVPAFRVPAPPGFLSIRLPYSGDFCSENQWPMAVGRCC